MYLSKPFSICLQYICLNHLPQNMDLLTLAKLCGDRFITSIFSHLHRPNIQAIQACDASEKQSSVPQEASLICLAQCSAYLSPISSMFKLFSFGCLALRARLKQPDGAWLEVFYSWEPLHDMFLVRLPASQISHRRNFWQLLLRVHFCDSASIQVKQSHCN